MLLAIAGSLGKVSAQQPAVMLSDKEGWHKIGETKVDLSKDHDEIIVLMADRFSAIKFKVDEQSIHLMSMDVYFETGDKQSLKIDAPIQAAGESRVLNINGGERDLKKITFTYKTMPNAKNKMAKVEVWGMKTNPEKQHTRK